MRGRTSSHPRSAEYPDYSETQVASGNQECADCRRKIVAISEAIDMRRISILEQLENRRLLSTYYVSTAGNNAAAGTAANAAWRTLQFAADRAIAGDTIIVAPGNYVGFDIRHSGTSTKPIIFKAQAGAIINQVNTKTNRD